MKFHIEILKGKQILPHLEFLKKIRIDAFKHYPYFVQTTDDHETYWLSQYVTDSTGLIIIASDDNKMMAAVTGIALV